MKKILSLLLSCTMLISGMAVVSADDIFTDFSKDQYSWAYDQVMDMVERGYINGYDDNTFKPDNSVTRLEVLALFSRALGALNDANSDVLDMAVSEYKDVLSEYALPWGTDEISFLLYRDVLTVDDLTTYLADDLKNEAMPRHEAAVVITKAMGGKKAATSSQSVALDFTDILDIPSSALQYVKYVSDNGIMTGMEDGSFSPNTSVLRSQMAVMLSRVVDKMNYSVVTGKLSAVDTDGRIITITDDEGTVQKYTYLSTVLMKVEGEETSPKYMTVGVPAVVTLSNNRVAFVDTLSSVPDETVVGTYQSKSFVSGVTRVTIKDIDTNESRTIECSPSVSVLYNGEPSTLANFKQYDYVTLELSSGVAEAIYGERKEVVITNAVVEEITVDPEFTMTISHAKSEYDGATFEISQDATVNKNNDVTDFSEIYAGDKVTLTLVYGVITGVKAQSSTSTVEGTLKSLLIANTPSIVIRLKDGTEEEYNVLTGVDISINGEKGSLYDFRVGDTVKVTLESKTVTKISTTSAQSANGKLEGKITAVNKAIGFIKLACENADGYNVEEVVYCSDSATKVMTDTGTTKKISDLAEGQYVSVHGTTASGAFTAKVIIISQ